MSDSPTRVFRDLDQLESAVGELIPSAGSVDVTQALIDAYADVSGDDQWIHVDAERAATGPFGTTIAHGNLTLTVIPKLVQSAFAVTRRRMGLNYGFDRVRFIAPVPVGSRLDADVRLLEVKRDGDKARVKMSVSAHTGDRARPACVAEALVLIFE